METTFRNRRRNYFIKKKFQLHFIIKFCLLVITGTIASGVIIYMMSRSTVTTVFENSRLVIKSTAEFILPAVLLSSIVVTVVIGLATIFITLFTSHRIAGPLYRIEKDVGEVASGNLKKSFNLRQTDEIKPLAEALNEMAKNLKSEMEKIKCDIAELENLAAGTELKKKIEKLKKDAEKFIT